MLTLGGLCQVLTLPLKIPHIFELILLDFLMLNTFVRLSLMKIKPYSKMSMNRVSPLVPLWSQNNSGMPWMKNEYEINQKVSSPKKNMSNLLLLTKSLKFISPCKYGVLALPMKPIFQE